MQRSLQLSAALLAASLSPLVLAADPAKPAQPDSSFSAGLGVAVLPEYSGSDKHRALPMLDFAYVHKNGFFASGREGIGMRTEVGPVSVSAALGYDGGRKERDRRFRSGSDDLRGMGDVRGSTLGKLSVRYDFGFMTLGMEAELALTHRERGNRLEFAAGFPLLGDPKNNVALFAALNVADGKNMRTYYGVTRAQSERSGYRVYSPKSGVEKVGLGLSWNHQFDERWSLRTMGGAFSLVGDAADSPIVKRKTTPVLVTTINRKF